MSSRSGPAPVQLPRVCEPSDIRRAPVRRNQAASVRTAGASDQGSASVWVVGAVAVLCAVFGVVLGVGQAAVTRHRAAAAADLAARTRAWNAANSSWVRIGLVKN
ncbi:pilus assembly protein TadG-related protein, partial [Streptomyces sp. NPDC005568]|uniref:pilus assembly protein TadG-related protein n=1 Tax=Streptomyces sp. NPDC005568 TaxID=3156887 RepID=UPI0033B3D4EC